MTTYTAHFSPEAWVNDQAIPVDPEGSQEWDCTEYARQHAGYLARLYPWRDTDGELVDTDDVFKYDPAAPTWVQEWRGPFTIRIREAGQPDPDDIDCGLLDEDGRS